MRNPLTRDRLNAVFPGRPDIVRGFEELAQMADAAPNSIEEAQASATLAADAATSARATANKVAEGLEIIVVQVLEMRSQRTEIAALTRRLADLESTIYTGRA